ncbi:SdpI family protein [Flavobacterium sp. CS20]|uniref:SdpI family protein n=1 Tax=Flavobacterium sp. CS20 TaxID=2775246 RepID=UPI0035304011
MFMSLENNSTTIILCVLSVITLITGFWFYFNHPKKINIFYGYRTKSSMKSQKHWDFAHFYSGKLFILLGVILLISALLIYLLNLNVTNQCQK